jgi:hypothetical protein
MPGYVAQRRHPSLSGPVSPSVEESHWTKWYLCRMWFLSHVSPRGSLGWEAPQEVPELSPPFDDRLRAKADAPQAELVEAEPKVMERGCRVCG